MWCLPVSILTAMTALTAMAPLGFTYLLLLSYDGYAKITYISNVYILMSLRQVFFILNIVSDCSFLLLLSIIDAVCFCMYSSKVDRTPTEHQTLCTALGQGNR